MTLGRNVIYESEAFGYDAQKGPKYILHGYWKKIQNGYAAIDYNYNNSQDENLKITIGEADTAGPRATL